MRLRGADDGVYNRGVRLRYTGHMSMKKLFRRVASAAKKAALPGIEEGTWYGTPALLVKGKGFARMKDDDTIVFRCALEEKEVLMEAKPRTYFETDHYRGWPAVLVRGAQVTDAELVLCVKRAWMLVAPASLRRDAARADAPPRAKKTAQKARVKRPSRRP